MTSGPRISAPAGARPHAPNGSQGGNLQDPRVVIPFSVSLGQSKQSRPCLSALDPLDTGIWSASNTCSGDRGEVEVSKINTHLQNPD